MVSYNTKFNKVRQGLAKCPVCGAFYNPTFGKYHCPPRRFYVAIFAAIIIALFMLMPGNAGAQTPEPTPVATVCQTIDGEPFCTDADSSPPVPTATAPATPMRPTIVPFVPASTPIPAPTVAPTVTPTPTIVIQPLRRYVYLSLIMR